MVFRSSAVLGSANARAPQFTAGVIDDARARRRRRGLLVSVAVACAGVAAGLVAAPSGTPRTPTAAPPRLLAASTVLSGAPYLGVACHPANVTACDRVGLEVSLLRPAVSVSATIAGLPLSLDTGNAAPFRAPDQRVSTVFVGYLHTGIVTRLHVVRGGGPLGYWAPSPTNSPSPAVVLRIDYGAGRIVVTRLNVALQAGWG